MKSYELFSNFIGVTTYQSLNILLCWFLYLQELKLNFILFIDYAVNQLDFLDCP